MVSEGEKQAVILKAEAEKESAILRAEAEKQSAILKAEAARISLETEAQGRAEAIKKINEANPNTAYVTMQGFDTLKELASSPSSKLIVPTELANVTGLLSTMKETLKDTKKD